MQTPTRDVVDVRDVVITVDDGLIVSIDDSATHTTDIDVQLPSDHVLIPGLIDLHIHAPQWPQLGTGYDLPLERWLFEYTFPLEASFADTDHARKVWDDMVPSLLANGTTTAVYYSSIHVDATTALAETCIHHGQRAWVGRVAMDHPTGTPETYRDPDAATALERTRVSIDALRALDDPRELITPTITPRFIPACSDELLRALGELATETGLPVQTHCSEDDWEHQHVLERYGTTDTTALDEYGLLDTRAILAHAGHLTDDDLTVLAHRAGGIAHCPLSNIYFGNAVFPAARALSAGLDVGLGTDIAGGPSSSLLAQIPASINAARMLEEGVDPALPAGVRGRPASRIDTVTAFWMATVGGATVLDAPLGLLEPGRRFDAVAVDTSEIAPNFAALGPPESEIRFERVARLASRRNVTAVWVDGQLVHDTPNSSKNAPT